MRLLDLIRSKARDREEQEALRSLRNKLLQGSGQRETLIAKAPLPSLAGAILDFEGLFSPAPIPQQPTSAETVLLENLFRQLLALREGGGAETALDELLEPLATAARFRAAG